MATNGIITLSDYILHYFIPVTSGVIRKFDILQTIVNGLKFTVCRL